MHHPTDRIAHTTAFATPVMEHWLKREIAQWVHPMKDRSDDPSHHVRTLLPRSYISLPGKEDMFNLRMHSIHMVEDHSDSKRGNLLAPHYMGYSFQLALSVLLHAPSHRQDRTVVEHWLVREIPSYFTNINKVTIVQYATFYSFNPLKNPLIVNGH